MNSKVLTIVSASLAVIAAAVAAILVTNNRATIARKQADRAEFLAEEARRAEKKARAEESAEASRRAIKEAEAKTAEENRRAKDLEQLAAEANAKTAEAEREKSANEAKAARDLAQEAADKRAEAKSKENAKHAELEALRVAAAAEVAKSNLVAQAAADTLERERLKAEKILAESKLLENRKIDFETWQARLLELEQELAEQKRALTPDISINDSTNIVWVGEREPDVIGGDTNVLARIKRKKVLAEDDFTLPEATRMLARQNRRLDEELAGGLSAASNTVIRSLTRLYVQAVRDGRVTDAEYYRRSIKHYYPNWEYKKP